MTKFSKVLAVFVAVASLAFMGFAIATTFGGPDWEAVMQSEHFHGYRITRIQGENPVWEAVRASDETKIATSPVLPEVLSKVMNDILRIQQQELQELNRREPLLQARIAELSQFKEVDEQALVQYEERQRERLVAARQLEADLAAQVLAATSESQKLENTIAARREDILQLELQYQDLLADRYRLEQIQTQLKNLLHQTQSSNNRADLRAQLLNRRAPADDGAK